MQGLITWRIEAGNPRVYISDAVKAANEAMDYLTKSFTNIKIAADFSIEIASILSYLVGETFKMPKYDPKGIAFDRLLSFELVKSLQGQHNESG